MSNEEKDCPFCGEIVKAIAIKCKHCQSDLNNLGSLNKDRNSFDEGNFNKTNTRNDLKYELIPHGFVILNISYAIIGIFIQLIVSYSIFKTEKFGYEFYEIYSSEKWRYLHFVVFSISGVLDFYNLKKLGIQVKYGLITSLFSILPVYLYLRGTKLNEIYELGWVKSQSFFIAWIISFAISIPLSLSVI